MTEKQIELPGHYRQGGYVVTIDNIHKIRNTPSNGTVVDAQGYLFSEITVPTGPPKIKCCQAVGLQGGPKNGATLFYSL